MTTTKPEPRAEQAKPLEFDDLAARPRLGHDVLFYDTGQGVVIRNTDKVYVVKGEWAYRFMCSLAPYLTGEYTLRDLSKDLAPERQAMAVSLVRSLVERGFVRNVRLSGEVGIDPAVAKLFASQLSYVEHFVDEANTRFLRFRAAKVLMLGTGRVNRAAAESLLRNGLGSLSLVTTSSDSAAEDTAEAMLGLAECVAELTEAGCPPQVLPSDLTVDDALASHVLIGYDFVVASSDDVGMAALQRLIDASINGGPAVLPATSIGSRVIIGPITRPTIAGCWMCSMLRYGANAEANEAASLWHSIACGAVGPTAPGLNPQLAAMVGNLLAFDLFRLITGCFSPETDHGVLIQNTSSLGATRERLWPHPLCPSCAEHQSFDSTMPVTPSVVHDRAPEPFSVDQDDRDRLKALLADSDRFVGRYTGLLSGFDDVALDQSPLKVSRVRLGAHANPVMPARLITAFDLHYVPVARRNALRAALLVYVDQIACMRRAVIGSTEMHNTLPPTDLSTSTGLNVDGHERRSWLPATSLVSGERRLVPAAAVYPFSALNSDSSYERSGAGGGAGATIGEAVQTGLLSAMAFDALRNALSGRGEPHLVLCGDLETGSELEFLLRTFNNLDVRPEVLEISRWRNASIVLARTTDSAETPLWTVQAALSREAALVGALRDLAGLIQMLHLAKADEVDLGEPILPGFDARVVHASGDPLPESTKDSPGDVVGLVSELAEDGRDVLVVETTTPELRSQATVTSARVLLSRCK